MGCRLITFLSVALPKHPHYDCIHPKITSLRETSLEHLDWIKKRVDIIAQKIDEEQLNEYVLGLLQSSNSESIETSNEFAADVSYDGNEVEQSKDDQSWETFSGWSDEVSFDRRDTENGVPSGSNMILNPKDGSFPSYEDFFFPAEKRSSSELDNSILKTLACQDVRYETDSEAVDSWAQDAATSFQPSASNPSVTHEAARIVFHDIMQKVTVHSNEHPQPSRPCRPSTGVWDLASQIPEDKESSVLGIVKFSTGSDTSNNSSLPLMSTDSKAVIQQEWVSFDSTEEQF